MPELEQRLRRDRSLLDVLPVAVYVTDPTGRICYFNEAAADLWGVRPELGSDRWCGSWRLYRFDGSPLPHEACPMAQALATGVPVRGVEAMAERPDGSRVRFLPYPTPLRDHAGRLVGAINLLTDVGEVRQAQADSQRLASIVASSSDAIVSKSLDGRITSWNLAASRIFGYGESEMISKSILELVPEDLRHEEERVLAWIRAGHHVEPYETVRLTHSGRRIDVALTVSPLRNEAGEIVGASEIARDISGRKAAERTQELLIEELSHRVKNTLSTVQALASQSLRDSRGSQDFLDGFNERIASIARAHDLISAGSWRGVEIGALVRDQVLLGAEDSRITCSGPPWTLGPQQALHLAMVLHELGTNARKHGALAASRGRVSIGWTLQEEPSLELELRWREQGRRRPGAPGARGFGMRLIEQGLVAHGGEATLSYELDGLRCVLRLPLPSVHELGAYQTPELPTSCAREMPLPVRGKRILVVEDEPLVAMDMESALREDGFEVVGPAANLPAALRLLREGGCDAALVDANLRGERIDPLTDTLASARVPFVFVTGCRREALPAQFATRRSCPSPSGADSSPRRSLPLSAAERLAPTVDVEVEPLTHREGPRFDDRRGEGGARGRSGSAEAPGQCRRSHRLAGTSIQ